MQPIAFVEFAKSLLKRTRGDHTEPRRRTAVNRAYLGALLEAARHLEPLRTTPYPTNAQFYGQVEIDLGSQLGAGAKAKLVTLRGYRRDADYEIGPSLQDWIPGQAVGLAEEIARVLREKFGA